MLHKGTGVTNPLSYNTTNFCNVYVSISSAIIYYTILHVASWYVSLCSFSSANKKLDSLG